MYKALHFIYHFPIIQPQHVAALNLLLWALQPGDIDQLLHSRHLAGNTSSVTLTANVESWTYTCIIRIIFITLYQCAFSAWTLLVGRQEGHPAYKKTEWWGAGVAICLVRGADLHIAQLMPLQLTVSCFSKIQIGFTFLVPAHLGSPGKKAVKWVCVCVWLLDWWLYTCLCL